LLSSTLILVLRHSAIANFAIHQLIISRIYDGISIRTLGGVLMHTVNSSRGKFNRQWEAGSDLSGDIARIVRLHGEDADIVAAKRADLLFRTGDTIQGTRWAKIFRTIAATHLGRAQTQTAAQRTFT
jgi:hypothetical protein